MAITLPFVLTVEEKLRMLESMEPDKTPENTHPHKKWSDHYERAPGSVANSNILPRGSIHDIVG